MTISLRPQGPFSLPEPLHLALTDDGGDPVAFRAVWEQEAGEVEVDFTSDLAAERVERHVARVLSLDVDATGLAEVGERDHQRRGQRERPARPQRDRHSPA